MVLKSLAVILLTFAFQSCSSGKNAEYFVLEESQNFLTENFQITDSEEFLRECLFPIAFREGWLESWETTRQAMEYGSGNPLPEKDLIDRLDLINSECGGSTLSATNYGRLRGIVVLNRSLDQSKS